MRSIDPRAMDRYRKTARRRRIAAERQRQQRLEQGWALARHAAALLRERFHAQSVLVFGSLIHPERFHVQSDVDLAVRGVDECDFLNAVAAVTSLDHEIEVDLIAVEEVPPALQACILSEGVPI